MRDAPAPSALTPAPGGTSGVPDNPPGNVADQEAAQRVFSTALLISAVRCLLTYIALPFIAPALGLAAGVGPALGIVIGVIAIGANLYTVRRFHRVGHRFRWAYSAVAAVVVVLLMVLLAYDIAALF